MIFCIEERVAGGGNVTGHKVGRARHQALLLKKKYDFIAGIPTLRTGIVVQKKSTNPETLQR
jgi:hypothetical protein